MARRAIVVLVVVVAIGLLVSSFSGALLDRPAPERVEPVAEEMIQPGNSDRLLWPYTSRHRTVEARTLAINVVIHGEPDHVKRALTQTLDGNWTEVEGDETIASETENVTDGDGNETDDGNLTDDDNETDWDATDDDASNDDALAPEWRNAEGAARYTYVTTNPNETGEWVTADYQLASGTYFGERTHIRAYTSEHLNWTAIQAHNEYWDWFRLRHTVTGVAPGARFVEQDLRDEPGVDTISRVYHGFDGGGSDGWLTVIELTSAMLLFGFSIQFGARVVHSRDLLLPVTLAAIVLGVRTLGVGMEATIPGANPKVIAGGLYPILAFGPPIAVSWLARERPEGRALVGTVGGLGAGFVIDFGLVGVSMLPIDLVFQRLALLAALALLTLGVARGERATSVVGAGAWFLGLAAALVGLL